MSAALVAAAVGLPYLFLPQPTLREYPTIILLESMRRAADSAVT